MDGFSSTTIDTNSDIRPFFGCCSLVYTSPEKNSVGTGKWMEGRQWFSGWDGMNMHFFSGADCWSFFWGVNGEG